MKSIKIFAAITLMLGTLSCADDDRVPEGTQELNISGKWKIDHYEARGKQYSVTGCDVNDEININSDKSGTYIDNEFNSSTNGCYQSANIAGKWQYTSQMGVLQLTYNINSAPVVKDFQIETISNTEIKIVNTTKTISGVPTTDPLIEVWMKK